MTRASAYGRISLLGNPSDLYGGKCISFTFEKKATVSVDDARSLLIENSGCVERTLAYTGTHNLIKATIRTLGIQQRSVAVDYSTTIPVGYGFAGSSAIVVAAIRAFDAHFGLHLSRASIAELALRTEIDELGIAAGCQDRYAISFEGLTYMDFTGKEYL